MASVGSAGSGVANLTIKVPNYAMAMMIGSGGRAFSALKGTPEIAVCILDQVEKADDGLLRLEGSIRGVVAAAERVADIINTSFECNVRRASASSFGVPKDRGALHRDYPPTHSGRPRAPYERPARGGYSGGRTHHRSQSETRYEARHKGGETKRHRSESPPQPPQHRGDPEAEDSDG